MNRVLLDMPMLMGRTRRVRLDDGTYVPDTDGYDRTLKLYGSLFRFLLGHGLLRTRVELGDIREVIVRSDDLTEDGRRLWETGAVYRWLESFDRSATKSFENCGMLERALSERKRERSKGSKHRPPNA